MEIFKNKFLVKLIATICLFLTLLNFAGTTSVQAVKEDDEVWGGVLVNPIVKLLTAIGDSIMELLHKSIQEQKGAIIKVSGTTSWLAKAGAILAGIVIGIAVAVLVIAAVIATSGLAAWAAAAIAAGSTAATFTVSISAGTVLTGAVAGVLVGTAVTSGCIPNDIYLPAFSLTAEEIFSNEIALFDVNFFEPNKYTREEVVVKEAGTSLDSSEHSDSSVDIIDVFSKDDLKYEDTRNKAESYLTYPKEMTVENAKKKEGYEKIINLVNNSADLTKKITDEMTFKIYKKEYKEGLTETDSGIGYMTSTYNGNKHIYRFGIIDNATNEEYLCIRLILTESYTMTTYTGAGAATSTMTNYVGKEEIGFDELKEGESVGSLTSIYDTVDVEVVSTAAQLQGIVSTWYFILRNIALLVLMLLLIYSGIRIVLGSTAGEKAKYKERIMDWLVAVCLIFVMHYIMVFAVEIVEKITDLVGNTVNQNAVFIELTEDQEINATKEEGGQSIASMFDTTGDGNAIDESMGDYGTLVWPTDLAGLFRIQSQMTDEGTSTWVGYSFCYFVLTLFTLFFAFTYAKRVLYMAFLTMIAPLVAMTYPIDKISDGKAQAFDAWLKEYIFNLMIQPLHLLLYSILVTSAYTLASTSPVYALVAIGFMMPAEKLMRRFFGFEKAKTPGLLGGAAGAAIAMSGLQGILKGSKSGGGNANRGNDKSKDQNKVKMARANNVDIMGTIGAGSPRQPGGGNTTVRQPGGGGNAPQGGGAGPQGGGGGQPGAGGQRPVIGGPGDTGSQRNTNIPQDNTSRPYDPRLTQDQIDEMRAEGIGPGDAEYDSWCQQFGVDEPYDPRLTQDQIDEMRAEGIEPGDAEYDNWCRQFGVDPSTEPGSVPQTNDQPAIDQPAADQPAADQPAADQPDTDLPDGDQPQLPDNDNSADVTHDESGREHKRHIWGAVGTAMVGAGKQMAVGALTGIHPMKFAGRVAAGAAVGAIGLGLGVASGDPNKAFQYTTAGAVAGSAFANSLSNTKLIDGNEMKDDIQEAYYGQDYQRKMMEKEREKFEKDKQNLEYLRKTLKLRDTAAAKEVMENTGRECFNNGITDIEDIATIHQLKNDSQNPMSFEYAVAARNYAKKRLPTDTKSMSEDKIEKYKKTWAKEFADKGYQNSDQLANNAWNAAVRFNKAKSGLKDI